MNSAASARSDDKSDPATEKMKAQQDVLEAYSNALRKALAPLEDRYKKALVKLTDIQKGYYGELQERLTAAYQSYGETVAAIPAGSPKLELAVEAYNTLLARYGEFADPGRWTELLAPAQKTLGDAVAEAQASDDAERELQEAVAAYYADLNDVLQNDSAAQALTDAQTDYVEQLQDLLADMAQGLEKAVASVNESIQSAITETADAYDLENTFKSFVEELKAIGEAMTQAYAEVAGEAADSWDQNWSGGDPAIMMGAVGASPLAAAAAAVGAQGTSPMPQASAAVAQAMAASPASMPRASWVNVPASDDEDDAATDSEGTGSESEQAKKTGSTTKGSQAKASGSSSSGRGKGSSTKGKA